MPNSPCNYTTQISEEECIGDSLDTINANFSALDVAVCNLVTTPITVSDSSTIDLSLTTNKILSADVRPDSIRYSHLASWQTLSASPTLSAEAVQPRLAKAWITFRGTGTVAISSAFNVSSITDNGIGDYTINFIQPMTNLGYAIAGTVEDSTPNDIGGILYISSATTRTLNSIQIKSTGVDGPTWSFDSNSISLIVFDV